MCEPSEREPAPAQPEPRCTCAATNAAGYTSSDYRCEACTAPAQPDAALSDEEAWVEYVRDLDHPPTWREAFEAGFLAARAAQPVPASSAYYVVMTRMPGPDGDFVELEDENGRGLGSDSGAEWIERDDGLVALRIPVPAPERGDQRD